MAEGVRRVGWKVGLAAGVLVIVLLLVATDDRSEHASDVPSRSEAAPTPAAPPARAPKPEAPAPATPPTPEAGPPRTPAPAPPQPPAESQPPEPSSLLSEAIRAAVLALPAVQTRREGDTVVQRPVGAPEALSVVPAAGGGWRLRVRVEVERRIDGTVEPSTVQVTVGVLVDERRVPLQTRVVGEVDPAFDALFDD